MVFSIIWPARTGLPKLRKLMLAPFHLHRRMIEKIERVGLAASRGEEARIVAKMNALTG